MELGFISSILEGYTFEDVIDFAAENDFKCVELAAWKVGKSERRYAGVSHIDTENLTSDKAKYITDYCKSKNVRISSLAFYPNPMDENEEKREETIEHLISVIDAAAMLKINMVTTFIGRNQHKTVEENLADLPDIWSPVISHAERSGVKIAIENCPMLFSADQWPGGQNLMTTPVIWEKVFSILDSDNLGLNYDPSHFVWQMMDYISPIYEFSNKIFHAHVKDIKLYENKLQRVGTMAYPLDYMSPKLPGLGDVDWGKYISALTDIGYDSAVCLEIEDKAFENSKEKIEDAIRLSKKYMDNFII